MVAEGDFVYTPGDFLGWALSSGWRPGTLPLGVVYVFQAPVTRRLDESGRFVETTDLTVSNARMLLTDDGGPPVMVGCLNPGAAALVTQLEHLRYLGEETGFAAAVGTAGALTAGLRIGQRLVVSSALRTDGISGAYLPPAPVAEADPRFVAALRHALGPDTEEARTWTVPVPYRSTRRDLGEAVGAGDRVVEMEMAALFAAGAALGMRTAGVVVVSDVNRVEGWEVDWSDTTAPTVDAVHVTIDVIRELAAG